MPPDTTGKASVQALGESEKLVEVFMKQAAENTKVSLWCTARVPQRGYDERGMGEAGGGPSDAGCRE